jgi:hypothetical protein
MLLNLSNHSSLKWERNQLNTATEQYGRVTDIPFPVIAPSLDAEAILELAKSYLVTIQALAPVAVHVMGEMNFTFQLVTLLKQEGIACVASTTHRDTEVFEEKKIVSFKFVQFRSY